MGNVENHCVIDYDSMTHSQCIESSGVTLDLQVIIDSQRVFVSLPLGTHVIENLHEGPLKVTPRDTYDPMISTDL